MNNSKVFFFSFRPGFGGDFLASLFSNNDDHYKIKYVINNQNRYIIQHPLHGMGYDGIKNPYTAEQMRAASQNIASEVWWNYSEKHLILNVHYQGPLDAVDIPNMIPLRVVCDHQHNPIYYILAWLKLYFHDSGGKLGAIELAKRTLKATTEVPPISYADVERPIELVTWLWKLQHEEVIMYPGYHDMNISTLLRSPEDAIEEWYDVFEINRTAEGKRLDIEQLKAKYWSDIALIEKTFGISIGRLLDPTLGRPWLTRLEDIVMERLDVYHKNKQNL